MATKTISLELDAYEKLRSAKRRGESFSSVVRRCVLPDRPKTGQAVLDFLRSRRTFLTEDALTSAEEADRNDMPPENPWEEKA